MRCISVAFTVSHAQKSLRNIQTYESRSLEGVNDRHLSTFITEFKFAKGLSWVLLHLFLQRPPAEEGKALPEVPPW